MVCGGRAPGHDPLLSLCCVGMISGRSSRVHFQQKMHMLSCVRTRRGLGRRAQMWQNHGKTRRIGPSISEFCQGFTCSSISDEVSDVSHTDQKADVRSWPPPLPLDNSMGSTCTLGGLRPHSHVYLCLCPEMTEGHRFMGTFVSFSSKKLLSSDDLKQILYYFKYYKCSTVTFVTACRFGLYPEHT
jgi:hypothetical protein